MMVMIVYTPQKETHSEPTPVFQVLSLLVSGRVSICFSFVVYHVDDLMIIYVF